MVVLKMHTKTYNSEYINANATTRPQCRVRRLQQADSRGDSWQQSHTLTERQFICLNSHCFGPTVMTDILNCRRIRHCEPMATFIAAACMIGRINSKPAVRWLHLQAGNRKCVDQACSEPSLLGRYAVSIGKQKSTFRCIVRALIFCLTTSIKALRSF
jgi:hypothetical protein